MYGLFTWTSGPCAEICIYRKSDERVIEIPEVSIPPGNQDAADQFGNKPCLHLKTGGDLYALPDQFQVEAQNVEGWYQLAVDGVGQIGTGFTQLEFCAVGDSISLSDNDGTSIEYGPILDFYSGQQYFGKYSGALWYWGPYSGHCDGVVDSFGVCAPTDHTDWNGMNYPFSLPDVGYKPGITYKNFDVRSLIPNFNGYTFDDIMIAIGMTLRNIISEAQIVVSNQRCWQEDMPDCLVDALNGLRLLQIDSIAYLRDLVDLPRALSIFREIKRRPLSKKTWSDTYLTYRYGLRLFANDTLSIAKAISKEVARNTEPFQTARGMRKRSTESLFGSDIEHVIRAKVYADNYSLSDMSLIAAARSIDLYPSLSNIWDLIPYSFVVDWLLPAGTILGKLDAQSDVQDLHTRSCVASVKSTKHDHIGGAFGYSGDVTITCYQRKVLTPNDMSRALSSDSVNFLDGVTPVHFFDGLALRFQRH